MIEADHPWKEVCDKKLSLVLELLYDGVHQALDWAEDYEGLDQELRKFAPASEAGGRIADRLIKAFAKGTGDPRYLHLEVQGKKERGFRRRVHVCNLRAEERFNTHVASLVILTDTNPKWRPRGYRAGLFPGPGKRKKGQPRYHDERSLRFLTVKLIDFRGREEELERMDNPVGLFVVAHLEALRTRKDPEAREDAKLRLLKNLRQRKMDLEDLRLWTSCFDWFLQLPADREKAVWLQLHQKEKEDNVPYYSYPERMGIEKGLEQGLEQGITKGRLETLGYYLKAKYPAEAPAWLAAVAAVTEEANLQALCKAIIEAPDTQAVHALIAAAPAAAPQTPGT